MKAKMPAAPCLEGASTSRCLKNVRHDVATSAEAALIPSPCMHSEHDPITARFKVLPQVMNGVAVLHGRLPACPSGAAEASLVAKVITRCWSCAAAASRPLLRRASAAVGADSSASSQPTAGGKLDDITHSKCTGRLGRPLVHRMPGRAYLENGRGHVGSSHQGCSCSDQVVSSPLPSS